MRVNPAQHNPKGELHHQNKEMTKQRQAEQAEQMRRVDRASERGIAKPK